MHPFISEHRGPLLRLINQHFEASRKAQHNDAFRPLLRHMDRMQEALEEMGLRIHNPVGERYDESRTDCEASIANAGSTLYITEVLKPAVYHIQDGNPTLIQKAIVVADKK